MAACTSARRETDTIELSEAASHCESAFLAPRRHDRSTIRLEVYFFLATRANNIAGRWATNDRLKILPPGLVRLPFPLWTTRQTPRAPSDPHRGSSTIDVPQNRPWSVKEALELAPTATVWRAGPPKLLAGVRSRSRVRFTLIISHAYSPNPQLFHRLATNNSEMEPIVAVHANILSPTGPGLATEPPRYRRVATAPRSALVPNNPRLCRFPGRDAGFGAQRGFCHPLTLTLLASVIVARADGRW